MNNRRPSGGAILILVVAGLAAGLVGARGGAANVPPVHVEGAAFPPRELSAFNFFIDGARQIPNKGVVPFDINTPLFSDYASKHRFVWMPPGTSATYDAEQSFDFPLGTVLIKTFTMPHDLRDPGQGEQVLETRLLIHQPTGWRGFPYVWNEDTTEAYLKVAGGTVDVSWIHTDGRERTINYIVPNMNQCKGCHESTGAMGPIGPKARNLNRDYAYAHGVENQLVQWSSVGYLTGAPAPDDAPRLPVWDDPDTGDLNARARAYLEVNCMHCHNPTGPGNTSGLDLRMSQSVPVTFGVMKTPVAAGRGSGGLRFDIVPGKPGESILVYRMESTDPGVMMPEVPHRLVHTEGMALIREWISAMDDDGRVRPLAR